MTGLDLRGTLTAIYDEYRRLTPELVVSAAEPVDSPLHHCFEWDDDEAARKFRLVQAGHLIRRVQIRVDRFDDAEPLRVRAFLHVPFVPESREVDVDAAGRGTYVPTTELRGDPVAQAVVLRQMRRDWTALRRRWQHLEEFWRLVDADSPGDTRLTG